MRRGIGRGRDRCEETAGDPLPYSKEPSEGSGLGYGSDFGGCVTYGDIAHIDNSWLQPPMQSKIELNAFAYDLLTGVYPASS